MLNSACEHTFAIPNALNGRDARILYNEMSELKEGRRRNYLLPGLAVEWSEHNFKLWGAKPIISDKVGNKFAQMLKLTLSFEHLRQPDNLFLYDSVQVILSWETHGFASLSHNRFAIIECRLSSCERSYPLITFDDQQGNFIKQHLTVCVNHYL